MSEADKHPVLGSRRTGAGLHLAGLVVSSLAGGTIRRVTVDVTRRVRSGWSGTASAEYAGAPTT